MKEGGNGHGMEGTMDLEWMDEGMEWNGWNGSETMEWNGTE